MSGIAGIVLLDGTAATATAIAALTTRLKRRGPDGTHVRIDGPVALGHTLLATTPEALVEVLPLFDEPSGCTITADTRLDNREELMDALDLADETRTIGDGELILRAYLKWGDRCPTHLLGDFAFAIWDPRSASLFCARDQIGMRQLTYYHEPRRRFVFATEPNAIVALADIDALLNPDRISDYLSNMEGADLTSTFFSNIFRLPPAHTLKVERGAIELCRYWELKPEPELQLPSDEAYADAFLVVFTQAVRSRLRSTGSIGSMLSGGIDSNSVATVAASLMADSALGPLPTFSAIGPDANDCVETEGVLTAIQSPLFSPTTVNYAAIAPWRTEVAREVDNSAEPFDAKLTLLRTVYIAARRAGMNTILDGGTGDTLLGSDFHTVFLLRQSRIGQVFREVRGERLFWGAGFPVWRLLIAAAWQAFVPTPIRALRFKRGRRKADKQFLNRATAVVPELNLSKALARRAQVQRRDFDLDRIDQLTRVRMMVHPGIVAARERYDRIASALAIEPRDPFSDLRLMRFCLSLPRDQLQRDGWPKWILRRAMVHKVPDAVAWRRGKHHLGHDFVESLIDKPSGYVWKNTPLSITKKLLERYEIDFLFNWNACMARNGWISGLILWRGMNDEEC